MVPGPERNRARIHSGAIRPVELRVTAQLKDRQGIGVDSEKLDRPFTREETPERNARIILQDQRGIPQQEVSGLRKGIKRQQIGCRFQIGGSGTQITQPGKKAAALLAVGEVGLKIIKGLRRAAGAVIDQLDSRGCEGPHHRYRVDHVARERQLRVEDGKDPSERSLHELGFHLAGDEIAAEERGVQRLVESLQGASEGGCIKCFRRRNLPYRLQPTQDHDAGIGKKSISVEKIRPPEKIPHHSARFRKMRKVTRCPLLHRSVARLTTECPLRLQLSLMLPILR